jgi:hypothetical protein
MLSLTPPASMTALACLPTGVPADTAARSMSPGRRDKRVWLSVMHPVITSTPTFSTLNRNGRSKKSRNSLTITTKAV